MPRGEPSARRRRLIVLALAAPALAFAAPPLSPRKQGEDFDAMWRAIDAGYAYFDPAMRAAWKRLREPGRQRAARAASREAFIAVCEEALALLHDDNVALSERSPALARRVPFDTDIWAKWKDGAAVIEAVRTFSDADVAGLRPGQSIAAVDDVPLERALRERLGRDATDPRAVDWALRRVLAGPARGVQRLEVRDGARAKRVEIERTDARNGNHAPAILGRRIGDERDIGYVRVRIGADDPDLAAHFDGAMNYLKDTRGLILDLRENAGPGARNVTEAILARFIPAPKPWQVREARNGARASDTVVPRGDVYRAPVVVLVDRWTAGEGEALAAGLVAVADARLVGTATAGLRGEPREVKLPNSALTVGFPAERTLQVNGAPRESLRPAVPVDLAAPSGGPGDPILYQALKLFPK